MKKKPQAKQQGKPVKAGLNFSEKRRLAELKRTLALVGALHGQVIRLATNSKDYLNPMDIQLSHKNDKEALKLKSDFIITLCDLIAGGKDGLENDEKSHCYRKLY